MNVTTLWTEAINRQMGNLKVSFTILDDGSNVLFGYDKASGHLALDDQMTLERKASWVKDGHKTPEPEWCIFDGCVSRESFHITLIHTSLNDVPM